jgi:hypothetical protein
LSIRRAWVLGRPQPGPGEQLVPVPAALGDLGVHAQPGARLCRDQLQLVDVEPQLVQPVDPLGDPVALLVATEQLLAGEFGPQRVVAARQVGGHRDRVHVVRGRPPACRSNSSPPTRSAANETS